METQNLSTKELETLLFEKREKLSSTEKKISGLNYEYQDIEYEIEDHKRRLESIENEISELEDDEQVLTDEIEEIEAILLNQNGTIYSYSELEEAGQMVMFNV